MSCSDFCNLALSRWERGCAVSHLLGGIVTVAAWAFVWGAALAEDFRVENAVFLDNEKSPSSESVTIFHGGMVYDCLKSPPEIVVYDREAGRFILLDVGRRIRAELTTSDVAAFTTRIRESAPKHPDPVGKFLADPKFQERYEEGTRELTLSSPWATYRATLPADPETPAAIELYRDFSDWSAKLNAMLSGAASRPPFARLALDQAIADRKAIASQVVLTLSSGKADGRRATIRSTHRVVRPLAQADLDRVAQIRGFLREFKPVGFEQYRKSERK